MALCENSCPLHMNIPGYLQLLKEGRIEEAFELTLRDNPLPGTVGRICYFHCRCAAGRETVDDAVSQGEIHRYLADTMYKMGKEKEVYQRLIKEKLSATGKKIAIVGAGPAGLTAAFYLVRLGHSVTVYDNHAKAGGILQYGIPAYRLAERWIEQGARALQEARREIRVQHPDRQGRSRSSRSRSRTTRSSLPWARRRTSSWKSPARISTGSMQGYEFLEEFAIGKKLARRQEGDRRRRGQCRHRCGTILPAARSRRHHCLPARQGRNAGECARDQRCRWMRAFSSCSCPRRSTSSAMRAAE